MFWMEGNIQDDSWANDLPPLPTPPDLEDPCWELKRSGNVFKEPWLRAEMRQSFDQINISVAAVSVCEMRAIKKRRLRLRSFHRRRPRLLSPQSGLPRAEAHPPNRRRAFIIHPAAAPSPPQPITAGSCARCLPHLMTRWPAFDVSIDTEEAQNRALMEQKGIICTACLWGGGAFFNINMFNSWFIWESAD